MHGFNAAKKVCGALKIFSHIIVFFDLSLYICTVFCAPWKSPVPSKSEEEDNVMKKWMQGRKETGQLVNIS